LGLASMVALVGLAGVVTHGAQQEPRTQEPGGFTFRSSVELLNVTATVSDQSERFVSGLQREDFTLFEDGVEQPSTHFSDDRVPVSLGIVLDTSGSMQGEKWDSALNAIDRFVNNLLDPEDEMFLYAFSDRGDLVVEWTSDRDLLMRGLRRVRPRGGTAMYDAVAEAVPIAQSGSRKKKALLLISDGNDHNSDIDVGSLRRLIRETEVLVYAIGIDGDAETTWNRGGGSGGPRFPLPIPIPGRRPPVQWPGQPQPRYPRGPVMVPGGEGLNTGALRELTDDSGGRTEVVRDIRDLGPATAGIADELSKQYSLAYTPAAAKDGRWHSIKVEVKNRNYRVRARRGYIATS
jgi:Ca-activated chloride channel homolog